MASLQTGAVRVELVTTSAVAAAISTTTAATTITPASTTTSAFGFGAGLVNSERSSAKLLAVQGCDCFITLTIIRHFNKAKTLGLPCVTISHDVYTINTAVCFKEGTDVLFGLIEAEISNENIPHRFSFDLRAEQFGWACA
jgi:hypothetical protein